MTPATDLVLYQDGDFLAARNPTCAIPGYLVVEPVEPVETIGELPPGASTRLGPVLGTISAAIGEVVGADRVYCLLFAEERRSIHFHLFPRAPWLLAAYRSRPGAPGDGVSAPTLFEWARFAFPEDADLPAGVEPWSRIGGRLRIALQA